MDFHEPSDSHFIIMPDGSLEPAKGRIPADVPVERIVLPVATTDLVWQAQYENSRWAGMTHEEAYVLLGKIVAKKEYPRRMKTFAEADVISWNTRTLSIASNDLKVQAKYTALRIHSGATHEQAAKWANGHMVLRGADFTAWLEPENDSMFYGMLLKGPGFFLDLGPDRSFAVPRTPGEKPPYGNADLPIGYADMTPGELVAQGFVNSIDGAPIFPVVSPDKDVQARYREMRKDGQSHKMAEMLACKAFPGIKTDSIFNEGRFSGTGTSGCDTKERWLREDAEAKGFSTNGLYYSPALARFPNDPEAWVGSRSDVLRVARERNYDMDGYVTHKGHDVEPKPDVKIDPSLVEDEVNDIMDEYPGARREEVYEEVYALRTGAIDNNPLLVKEPTEDWG